MPGGPEFEPAVRAVQGQDGLDVAAGIEEVRIAPGCAPLFRHRAAGQQACQPGFLADVIGRAGKADADLEQAGVRRPAVAIGPVVAQQPRPQRPAQHREFTGQRIGQFEFLPAGMKRLVRFLVQKAVVQALVVAAIDEQRPHPVGIDLPLGGRGGMRAPVRRRLGNVLVAVNARDFLHQVRLLGQVEPERRRRDPPARFGFLHGHGQPPQHGGHVRVGQPDSQQRRQPPAPQLDHPALRQVLFRNRIDHRPRLSAARRDDQFGRPLDRLHLAGRVHAAFEPQ